MTVLLREIVFFRFHVSSNNFSPPCYTLYCTSISSMLCTIFLEKLLWKRHPITEFYCWKKGKFSLLNEHSTFIDFTFSFAFSNNRLEYNSHFDKKNYLEIFRNSIYFCTNFGWNYLNIKFYFLYLTQNVICTQLYYIDGSIKINHQNHF